MDDGGKIVKLGAPPADAVLDKYGHLLGDDAPDAAIPPGELKLLRRAVLAQLQPATRVEVAAAVMVLAGSFKLGNHVEDPEIFVSGMIEELADYPADILEAAIRNARRSRRRLPSIADMVEICEGLIAGRRRQLRAVERLEAQQRQEAKA